MNTRSQAGNYSSGGILVAFVVLYDQNWPDPALLGAFGWIHVSQIDISFFDFLHMSFYLHGNAKSCFALRIINLMYKTRICILAFDLILCIVFPISPCVPGNGILFRSDP
jgi:hypothetical protein